ncbi:putative oxidoreductase YdhV [archaeon HR01]|nr:putative oxidoreductase YdhV [archaeon HR01]
MLIIARIELEDGSADWFDVGDGVFEHLLGGRGLGVGILSTAKKIYNPLHPSSPLILSVGALTGTSFPMANRLTTVFRSPLTGTVAWTQTGGYVGPELAGHGLDAVVITGKAEKLSYILFEDRQIRVVEAEWLRGLGAVETCSKLRGMYGDARILSIGPAGERGVRISTVVNDMGRSSGVRHGLGAVFGVKNLKAIVVKKCRETTRKIRDPSGFTGLLRRLHNLLRGSRLLNHENGLLALHGTAIAAEAFGEEDAIPVKNYRETVLRDFYRVGGRSLTASVLVNRLTCSRCPVSCRRDSAGLGLRGEGPDYAQISSLGTNCLILDLEKIVYLTQLCYEYGLDPIEMGNTLAVYAELSERGYVEKRLRWGDFEMMCSLIRQTAYGEDVGAVLGQGAYQTAKAFGEPDAAPSVKNISIQNTDPRAEPAWGLINAVESFGGATHVWVYPRLLRSFVRLGVDTIYGENPTSERAAEQVYREQIFVAALDSLGVCAFSSLSFGVGEYVEGLNALTGNKYSEDILYQAGLNTLSCERQLNQRYGFTEADDTLPKRFLEEPIMDGRHAGSVCPLTELLRYYRRRRRDVSVDRFVALISSLAL